MKEKLNKNVIYPIYFVLRAEDVVDIDNMAYCPGGPNLRGQHKLASPPQKTKKKTNCQTPISFLSPFRISNRKPAV